MQFSRRILLTLVLLIVLLAVGYVIYRQMQPAQRAAATQPPGTAKPGGLIAYVVKIGQFTQIYVMGGDGANPTQLTTAEAMNDSPAWSADGRQIGFTARRDSIERIYVINADGTGEHLLFPNDTKDSFQVNFSPDGK